MALHVVLLCESIIVHFFIKTKSHACSRSTNPSSSLLGNVIQGHIQKTFSGLKINKVILLFLSPSSFKTIPPV